MSAVIGLDDYEKVGEFFEGFLIPKEKQEAILESKL